MSISRKEMPSWGRPSEAVRTRQRGPGLLAVHDVVVALALGAHLDRREVRSRARLGVALAPPVVERKDARQEAALLCGAAESDDHRPDHGHAEGHEARRPGVGALHVEEVLLHRRPAGAAELLRPADPRPALGMQDLVPAHDLLPLEATPGEHLVPDRSGQARIDEGAHLAAERLLLGGEIEIHGLVPRCGIRFRDSTAEF